LKGQRFKILSNKSFNHRDIFSLQTFTQGTCTLAIPREWTDKADPNPYQDTLDSAPTLSFVHLQHLADLVSILSQGVNNEESH
jgi:hypothetical protein